MGEDRTTWWRTRFCFFQSLETSAGNFSRAPIAFFLLQLGQNLIPLYLSVLFIHLLSILQPALGQLDGDMLAADLGLDGRDMLLDSSVAKQQVVLRRWPELRW